ncbi:helix-turn-helix transcriptional regulator [Streptomyces sp. NPDC097981]|uniref:helix-turn-helix domain-containing protein n=1 Tax=Streptomyces sp. NPDC097981 TaxID=3155428 RepID=UPI0033172AE5
MTSSDRGGPGPGPQALHTVGEFIEALRALKALEGLSLRELQRRTGLPRTTIAHALQTQRPTLPPWDRALVLLQACGVPEAELQQWREAWTRLRLGSGEEPAEAQDAAGPGSVDDPPRRRSPRWRRTLTHAATLALGIAIGAGAVTGLTSASSAGTHVSYPVEEQPCPPGTPKENPEPVLPPAGSAGPASEQGPAVWVARPAGDTEILSGTDFVLPVVTQVTEGDALVVSLMLSATCPGRIEVTDTLGDEFRIVGDVTDARKHRTVVLAAFHARPLTTADSIRVVYPHASKYHVAVDEFRGISRAVGHAQAHGEAGGTAFSTSSSRLDCAPGDLVVGVVGTNSGTAPAFTAEWTALAVVKKSSYQLSTAYRVVPAAQLCAATGTTTAQWGALAVDFR